MAKNSIADWSTTAADNTDIGGVGITGNNLPSNLDDAIRTLMAQIKTDVYYRQNIVGAVSFSGSIPDGGIIEEGSNPNGYFVKWADGTQHCWFLTTDTSGATTASGSLFINASDLTWTFPNAFDTAAAGVAVTGSFVRADRIGGLSLRSVPGTTTVTYRYWASQSITAGATVTLILRATGKWG